VLGAFGHVLCHLPRNRNMGENQTPV
jgi:hypothetical protein